MSVFLDGIILLLLAVFVISGIYKGLIRSAINLIGTLVSAYLSIILGKAFAQWIYASFIKQGIITSVTDSLQGTVEQGTVTTVEQITENLPDLIKALVPNISESPQLQGVVDSGIDYAASTVEQIVAPIIIGICSAALTVVLFVLIMFAVRFFSRMANKLCRVPILYGVNRTLGGVLGFLKGSVLIMLFVSILKLFSGFDASYSQEINNTILFKLFYNFNIFGFIFK
ncbi:MULTISPECIES: CvpA family protein [unclassified Ruminococcus]|uniref:CvpA family protein n=1 Tax=unclassified Ruminococcus TaxID=2608920 RepID=UPI00210A4CB0|nr:MULTISPECIES: CvpA family protein [unclassified Ruminococcus]MCQ4022136.1 hypothetical protein [Ruminococcus sp. zg-924]MCQ4114456.1 hypothetical protein [Ruminococcus sp. zg-921]